MQKMFATFLLIIGTTSEFVGNVTVLPSKQVFKGLQCLSQACIRNIDPLDLKVQICRSSNCTNQTMIYRSKQLYFEHSREQSPLLSIILTNNFSMINSSQLIFGLPERHSPGLLNESVEQLELRYNYDCIFYLVHCQEKVPSFILKTLFLVLWVGITSLWIYNNHTANSADAELFHKFSTVILVFKTLNLLAMFSASVCCPIRSMMTREFLELFEKQTRSLYETSFFAYLLLLSKGWVLVVNTMDKKEFNYLIVVIIFIYILDSAVNIIGLGIIYLVYLLYLIVVVHVASFAVTSLNLLKTQIALIQETGMDLLLPVAKEKRKQFLLFLAISLSYFLSEFCVHWYFRRIGELDFQKQSLSYLSHEIIELIPIAAIFYLYRARKLGRFFSVELQSSPGFQRVLPFYEAKKECSDGILLAVTLPRGTLKLGKLV